MRKTALAAVASSFMMALAIASAIVTKTSFAAPPAPSGAFVWKDGPEVYAKVCAYCHEQGVGPAIRGRALPPVYIRTIVRNGNRAMPSFRAAEIDDDSLTKLAEYISAN
ncbi:cytochrome c [Nitrosospira sp. Is2]|uniref:cytochrome c n=1 Tax=Nitrosospira sp. Is2 TaxID=3080532 RepID=UPI002954B797|nr:cytochrome c [Nitrosospira sp. Is2]WON73487.1 cytochrome c [Nitrosospira sp. Is2]